MVDVQVIFNAEEDEAEGSRDDDDEDLERYARSITNSTLAQLMAGQNTAYPDLTDVGEERGGDVLHLQQQRTLEVLLVARLRTIQGACCTTTTRVQMFLNCHRGV